VVIRPDGGYVDGDSVAMGTDPSVVDDDVRYMDENSGGMF